ncbi:MAG: DUF4430 domain-containing protein [Firmicutes bacterium]|nr:DUF4430 domain-containing protein [Bacillota bacterium]
MFSRRENHHFPRLPFTRIFAIRIYAFLLALFIALPCHLSAASADGLDSEIQSSLSYLLGTDDFTDSGALASASDWSIISLARYGAVTKKAEIDLSGLTEARLSAIGEKSALGAVERQRIALALIALSGDNLALDFVKETVDLTAGEQGIMSYVFALHLIFNGAASENYTDASLISSLLSLAHEDGGWGLSDTSDTDVTAMTICALAPYYGSLESVTAAIDGAVSYLSGAQLEDGGFQSYGNENAESAAQVVIALTSLGRDPESDADFTKNGISVFDAVMSYSCGDGSFSHTAGGESNTTATSQCCCAMISYLLYVKDAGGFYSLTSDTESNESENESDKADVSDTTPAVTESSLYEETPENTEADENIAGSNDENDYKITAFVTVVTAALIIIAALAFFGKRNPKNFIFVAAVALLAIIIIALVDFSSPDDYYGTSDTKEGAVGSVTISISCELVAGNADYIPEDGIILEPTVIEISEGDTVYDVTVAAARAMSIPLDIAEGSYVRGIDYIYELDYGDLSGWVYIVNGALPSVGCGEYTLSDGDVIEWAYTLSLGDDVLSSFGGSFPAAALNSRRGCHVFF